MDLVTLTLGSPRGRFFLANVAYACSTDARVDSPYLRPHTVSDALEVIEGIDTDAIGELSEMALLDALAYATDFARYWQPPDEDDIMFADTGVGEALRPVAAAVFASKNTAWWGDPVDTDNQRFVVHPPSPADWPAWSVPYRPPADGLQLWREGALESEERFREHRAAHPDTQLSGEWWSTPIFGNTLTTSRARPGIGSLELILDEDSSGGGEARIWPVHVRGTPRVYEISGPSDWTNLVEQYPLNVSESRRQVWYETTGDHRAWHIPDWVAVARDYDAAHLSLHGYLTTPGITLSLSDNTEATLLGGWDPDATIWLDPDVVVVDDEPTLWRRDDERWEQT